LTPVESLYRLADIIKALLLRRPLALCDIGDLDGIVSASLFKMAFPRGVVVLASPPDVTGSILIRAVRWTFVADLPCPGRAVIRADHHETNTPCAETEFYDPSAPAAAVLAAKALGLEGFDRALRLVHLAVEADTASITSWEAELLSDAVKGASYRGKLYIVDALAFRELYEVLEDPRIRGFANAYQKVRAMTRDLALRLPLDDEVVIVVFRRNLGLSYRYLCILLEERGAKLTAIIVPRGFRSVRVYLGARSEQYDVSVVARSLGGGGHSYAAGALLKGFNRRKLVSRVLGALANYLGNSELSLLLVDGKRVERIKLRVHESRDRA